MAIRTEWWRWEFAFHPDFLELLMNAGDLEAWLGARVRENLAAQGGFGEPVQAIWRVRPDAARGYVRLVAQGTSLRRV